MGKHQKKCNSVGGARLTTKSQAMAGDNKRRKLKKEGAAQISSYLQLRNRALVLMPLQQKKRRRRSPSTTSSPCEKPAVVDSSANDLERAALCSEANYSSEAEEGRLAEQWSRSNSYGQVGAVLFVEQEEQEGGACPESSSCNIIDNCCSNVERTKRKREPTPSSELQGEKQEEEAIQFDNLERRSQPSAGRPTRTKPAQMPSTAEIEEFFAVAEKEQMKKFMEKYNYDINKDAPMDGGRYEWVKISP